MDTHVPSLGGCDTLVEGSAILTATGNGFLVVSRFLLRKPAIPPYSYDYSYTHYASLSDADEHYRDLLNGEYQGWEAVEIVPCLNGVPLGSNPIAGSA